MKAECRICPHRCRIEEGALGLCRARGAVDGTVVDLNYGKVTSAALDPIEKKPLAQFMPGSSILSIGSYGCNFRCGFCQNSAISMCGPETSSDTHTPEELVRAALQLRGQGNIGLAYTYNEPLIGWEFVRDTATLIHEVGLQNVVVTNGYINREPLEELLPLIDAFNIDLKSFSDSFYRDIGGDLETVKQTIEICSQTSHVEVTTLIIPGMNDADEEMGALSSWLAGINPQIPLHITRFFPRYKMRTKEATAPESVLHLTKIARRHLENVYAGNL